MIECDVLRWAAGGTTALPELEGGRTLAALGVDEVWLVALLTDHRLANRFLERCHGGRPAWCSNYLLASMLERRAAAVRQTNQQVALMREVSGLMPSDGPPLIPIKGFTAYALTGNPVHIYWSDDLDLFHCDLARLRSALLEVGFSERLTLHFNQFELVSCDDLVSDDTEVSPRVNGQHEFAKLARDPASKIEVHGYFPVFAYPAGVTQTDLLPKNNPGRWVQSFSDVEARGILYRDLLSTSIRGTAPDTRDFALPEPALLVLLRCAHIFAHYAVVGPFDNWMALKLVELAEIRDITGDSRFSKSRLRALIRKFGVQDAVNLASYLLHAYLGSDALAFAATSPTSERVAPFPRFFQWWRGWAEYYTAGTIDQLLLPTRIDAMVEHLGTNTISCAGAGSSRGYSTSPEGEDIPLERIIVHSTTRAEIPFRFSITLAAGVLTFDVEILKRLPGDWYQFDFEIIGENTLGGTYLHFFGHDSAGWSSECCHRSTHTYPWPDPRRPFLALIMIGLQDTQKDFFFSTETAVLAPLRIVLAQ